MGRTKKSAIIVLKEQLEEQQNRIDRMDHYINNLRNCYTDLYKHVTGLKSEVSVMNSKLAVVSLPPHIKLEQLRDGLKALASFANELQKEIEHAAVHKE